MNVDAYLECLNCLHLKNAELSLENLAQLQLQHVRTFLFENLDMHGKNKKHIPLLVENAYEKMVIQKRGGYCLELNGCFAWLLEQLGYNFYFVEMRVYYVMLKKFSTYLTHAAMIVNLNDKQYYVDVGLSRVVRAPLEFKMNLIQTDFCGTYRFVHHDSTDIILQRTANASVYDETTEWLDQLKFENIPRKFNDLFELNESVQTNKHPLLFYKTYFAKYVGNSCIILFGRTFTEIVFEENNQKRTDWKDLSDEEARKIIRERFQFKIDDSFEVVDEDFYNG